MNAGTVEERHRRLMEQIDGYLDDELSPAERAQMEAHLAGCRRCRRALHLHGRLAGAVAAMPIQRTSPRFRERLRQQLAVAEQPGPAHAREGRRPRLPPWLGWALAAGLAAGVTINAVVPRIEESGQIPMVQAAVANYRQHLGSELSPPDAQQLATLMRSAPFPVRPLKALRAQMAGAWRTTIRGEPAIAFAYYYHRHLLVQYVVSRELFFRQAKIRAAVARSGHYTATTEHVSVMAFPQRGSGSLLIGTLPLQVLQSLKS